MLTDTEVYQITRQRVLQNIGEAADSLGLAVVAKLDAKIKKGSFTDCLQIVHALLRAERLSE